MFVCWFYVSWFYVFNLANYLKLMFNMKLINNYIRGGNEECPESLGIKCSYILKL